MTYHIIFTENGKVQDCEMTSDLGFADVESRFVEAHPDATWWEIGVPLIATDSL